MLSVSLALYYRFALEILVGALAYVLALSLIHRNRLGPFFRLVKSFRLRPF